MAQLAMDGIANCRESGYMFTAIAIVVAFLGGVAAARAGRGMITGRTFDPFDRHRMR